MGQFLDELWEQIHPDYIPPTANKLFAMDIMVKSSKTIDETEKKELSKLIDEVTKESIMLEKKAFCDGVGEGCKIMVGKL